MAAPGRFTPRPFNAYHHTSLLTRIYGLCTKSASSILAVGYRQNAKAPSIFRAGCFGR